MRKKSEFTIVERAIQTVDGFQKVFNTLQQQTILRGQSQSTLENYIRQVALISLEFNKLPEDLSEDDINGYLTALALSPKSPSRSSFKHAIYGLRYYYRHIGQTNFTVPQELNQIFLLDSSLFYKSLFECVWMVLQQFEYTKYGVESGAICVLHTWGQNLSLHCKPPFGNAQQIVKYLGQYSHRVAISNHRIKNITASDVTFYYKDYKDESRVKATTLTGVEFLRRFCMHILPRKFVKIRYYGILSTKQKLRVQSLLTKKPGTKVIETRKERIVRLTGFDYNLCQVCKTGFMHTIEILPKIRAPTNVLYATKLAC